MKPLILLLISLLVSGAFARTDSTTSLVFPDVTAQWAISDFHQFDSAALGCAYSYKPKTGGLGAITCYVYQKNIAAIPTGADSDVVRREMLEVYSTMGEAWKQHHATVTETVPPTEFSWSEGGACIALYGVHRITMNSVEYISISAVTGYRGQFLKVRYTHPGRDVTAALESLSEFLQALLDANRETVESMFLAPQKKA